MPAASSAANDQPLPVPVPTASAFVVHGVAYIGPFPYKRKEVERAFRGKGGGVIGVRLLLHWSKRKEKTTSSLVVYLEKDMVTVKEMSVRMHGRKYTVVEYEWDRKGRTLSGW